MAFETLDPARAINPSALQASRFMELADTAGFSMVNLHEYYEVAQYPDGYSGASVAVSGREAYHRYLTAVHDRFTPNEPGFRLVTLPCELVMIGSGNWHEIIISIYPSREALLNITASPGFSEVVVHRDAGLKAALTLAVSGDMHTLCAP